MPSKWFLALTLCACAALRMSPAQDPERSVDSRLLEILKQNDQQPNANDALDVFGWHAQVGYMIVPQRFEIGLRYAEVDWEGSTAAGTATVPTNSASREYLIVFGYFWHEHNMKLQLDFGRNEQHFAPDDNGPNSSNLDEWRARMQFTLVF